MHIFILASPTFISLTLLSCPLIHTMLLYCSAGLLFFISHHPSPITLHPSPFTLHPSPFTLHPSPFTLHTQSTSADNFSISMLVFIAFFLSISTCSQALVDTSSLPNNDNLSSKRIFLSPRDLQGVYSRFLEVSENSTLCPNTIAHRTSGVLYPTGNIHLPFNEVSHDGKPCLGPGELVIRFRRRMKSEEIENEFNIAPNATGIDKMVLDILLSLDAFYFGRQSAQRKCAGSVFPSGMAFFFTSEAKPFAANVGVPFRRSPKILFVVDKTRVCAFSSSFQGSKVVGMIKNPTQNAHPNTASTPPGSSQSVFPSPSPSAVPTEEHKEPLESEESILEQPEHTHYNRSSKSKPSVSESPVTSPSTGEDTKTHRYKKNVEKQNKATESNTPSPVVKPQIITSNTTMSSPPQKKKKNTQEKHSEERIGVLHSPTPFHSKNFKDSNSTTNLETPKALPAVKPSKSYTPNPSKKPLLSMTPSSFPHETDNETVILSLSAHASPNPTGKAAELNSNDSAFSTGNIVPSSSPILLSLENSNMSDSHSDEDLYHPTPTKTPTEAEPEVILGDSVSTCFPSSAIVTLSSGGIKRMDEVSVGEFVYVGRGISSRIIDFTHYDHTTLAVFLRFSTDSGRKLTVTPSHFVYTDKKLVPAIDVEVGDYLLESDGTASRILTISTVQARGLFNPHTLHGDVVVDGFIVSTYTLAAFPSFAHSLLTPIRFVHQLGFRFTLLLKVAQHKTMVDTFVWAVSRTAHYIGTSL